MTLDALEPGATKSQQAHARAVLERFSRRLIGLARVHLGGRLQQKVDPEDVVQSAYKSLFLRYGAGALATGSWDGLWAILTLITIRKCADRARYYQADCRNLHREAGGPGGDDSASLWLQVAGREPTPDEGVVLAE